MCAIGARRIGSVVRRLCRPCNVASACTGGGGNERDAEINQVTDEEMALEVSLVHVTVAGGSAKSAWRVGCRALHLCAEDYGP